MTTTNRYANRLSREHNCNCSHYHSRVCASQQAHMSLVDAILQDMHCYCLCHLNDGNQQVSPQIWQERQHRKVSA